MGVVEPPRAGDVLHSEADCSKAERLLGWSAKVPLEQGLRETVRFLESEGPRN